MNIIKANILNMFSRYSTAFFQLLVNMILARLLLPEEFGTVAIINVFIYFFNILSDMGIGTSIIQRQDLSEGDVNSIYGFSLYLGLFLGLCFIFVSFFVKDIYQNDIYITFGVILSISILFNTLNTVPKSSLMKDKKFDVIAKRTIIINIISGIIAIFLAFLKCGVYALIFQSVCSAILNYLWNAKSSGLKLKLNFSFEPLKRIFNYSFFQFSSSLVVFATRNSDNMLIGYFYGESIVGIYDKSYQLMRYPATLFGDTIISTLHPYLSKYQDQKGLLLKNYSKVLNVISFVGLLASTVSLFFPKEIIMILYGPNWLVSVPCFQMLALSIWIQMLSSSCGVILQSTGKTNVMFVSSILNFLTTFPLLLIGLILNFDLKLLSFIISISYILIFMEAIWMISRFGLHIQSMYFYKLLKNDIIYYIATIILSIYILNYNLVIRIGIAIVIFGLYFILTKKIIILREIKKLIKDKK